MLARTIVFGIVRQISMPARLLDGLDRLGPFGSDEVIQVSSQLLIADTAYWGSTQGVTPFWIDRLARSIMGDQDLHRLLPFVQEKLEGFLDAGERESVADERLQADSPRCDQI